MNSEAPKYLWLKRERSGGKPLFWDLTKFYDKLIEPAGVIGLVVLFGILCWKALKTTQKQDVVFYFQLGLTFLVGIRLIQSCLLARRDYGSLRSYGLLAFSAFVVVIFFTSGGLLRILLEFELPPVECTFWVFVGYALFSCVGVVNFYHLANKRIARHSEDFDYPIEVRIQRLNLAVCVAYVSVFSAGAWVSHGSSPVRVTVSAGLIVVAALLTILNMEHSWRLTMRPKVLLDNHADSLPEIVASIREQLGKLKGLALRSDDDVLGLVARDWVDVPRIRTVRARRTDVDRLAETLFDEFGYVYSYVALGHCEPCSPEERSRIIALLRLLLCSATGFGALGFMSFYLVVDQESGREVGLVKVRARPDRSVLYAVWEAALSSVRLALFAVRTFGWRSALAMRKRALTLVSSQRLACDDGEMILDYLVIHPDSRGQGYATALLELLVGAYLREDTDEVGIDKIRLVVRKGNRPALSLFRRVGFERDTSGEHELLADPISHLSNLEQGLGGLLIMIMRANR